MFKQSFPLKNLSRHSLQKEDKNAHIIFNTLMESTILVSKLSVSLGIFSPVTKWQPNHRQIIIRKKKYESFSEQNSTGLISLGMQHMFCSTCMLQGERITCKNLHLHNVVFLDKRVINRSLHIASVQEKASSAPLLPCDPAVYWEEVVEFSLSWEGDCDLRCVMMGRSTGEAERTGMKSLVGALRPTFSRLLILRTIFP